MFKIAVIGRPNVGKSTLFNKLVGRKFAITDDTPGITRDRKEAIGSIGPIEFKVIDTAGLEDKITPDSVEEKMVEQTNLAIIDADLCLFVVDSKEGITNADLHFAKILRRTEKKTILVANKCENLNEEVFDNEYYRLGFGAPVAISAEHKLGFPDLYEAVAPEIEKYEEDFGGAELEEEKSDLQIAITGRPNAGKSTLLNQILGSDRLIVGPQAGITRDAIAIDHEFQGKKIRFIDTAGIRKKSNIKENVEKMTVLDSFRAIRFAQIVILLIDANTIKNEKIDHQDLALASEIIKEGRGLVFALNKIDEIKGDKEIFMKKIRLQIQGLFSEISGTVIVGISAQNGYNVNKCLEFALKTYDQWNSYIPTTKLVEWLKMAERNHPPRIHKGRDLKLKYATQIKKRPPTVAVFVNHIKPLEGSYKRYLSNSFRNFFNLDLTPIRIIFKKSDNPYEGRKEKTFSKRQSGKSRTHK